MIHDPSSTLPMERLRLQMLGMLGVIVLVTVVCFARALDAGFIFFDDGLVVTRNPWVKDGLGLEGIRWALTGVHAGNWMPLTWMSHQLDFTLFGTKPAGHHLSSLVIHVATASVLFLALVRLTSRPWPAAFVALLFSVHPLRVESVVWVAERKDVLSALWFACVLLLVARAGVPPRRQERLLWLVCLALGLASKSMLVTTPVIILLVGLWRDGRLLPLRLVLPESVLAAATSVIIVVAQDGTSVHAAAPLGHRLMNAVAGTWEYVQLTAWPAGLSIFHPARVAGREAAEVVVATVGLIGVTAACGLAWRRGSRAPLVGWLWFLTMLAPVSGLVPIGAHAIAERYTHLPHVGLFVGVVFGVADLITGRLLRAASLVAIVVVVAAGARTRQVVETWQSNEALAAAGLRVEPANPILLPVYGMALQRAGSWGAAIERMEHAMAARRVFLTTAGPEAAAAQLGVTLLEVPGRNAAALRWLQEAVAMNPTRGLAWRGLSIALTREGDVEGGIAMARRAVAVGQAVDDADNHRNLASLLLGAGRPAESLEVLRNAPPSSTPELADIRLRAAAMAQGCKGAAAEGDVLMSSLARPPPGFIDEYALALACVGDVRAVAVLEEAPPPASPSRVRLLADLVVTLRGGDPSPAATIVALLSQAPPMHGLDNARLAPLAERPDDLERVLRAVDR